jgi:hypothetical protein
VPEDLRVSVVHPVELPSHAVVDLWAGDAPVLARWEGDAGRRVLLALDLARSNLPVAVDFPILLRNVVTWLLPYQPRPTLAVGEAIELPPGTEVLTAGGPVSGVWIPDRPGLYELRGEKREAVAVNVPYDESLPGRAATSSEAPRTTTLADLTAWPWLALAAFLVLVAEWGLAVRRGS